MCVEWSAVETPSWICYVLACADGTLYAGVTTDLARRVAEHNAGRGARYTAGRRPVRPIAAWGFCDRGTAQRAEARFRHLRRAQKLALVEAASPFEGGPLCPDICASSAPDAKETARTTDRFCPL